MSIVSKLVEKMSEMPESSAVALHIDVDNYIDVLRSVLDIFSEQKDLEVIYLTSSLPSSSITNVLNILEVDLKRVNFVDCISHMMMGASTRESNVHYVESPTMLENIMIKIEYLMRRSQKSTLVFMDSMNSLAIHNNTKILSEFLHILVNNLRSKEAYTMILSIEEPGADEIKNMLNLVCDDFIDVSKLEGGD